MNFRVVALIFCAFFIACGPFLLLPGGRLSGTTAEAPSDWAWTEEVSTVQLETRPEDPYSVNIWAIGAGEVLYVHAGANRAAWVEHMEANPNVRVQIDEKVFELAATRVEAQAEFDAFADRYEAKYGSRPRNESVIEAYLFGLTAR